MLDPLSRYGLLRSGGISHPPVELGTRRPRVSVIIPCYNYGHFLAACVASALDHEDVDVEVIIVDDKSPDGSAEVAQAIADADDRVTLIRHEVNTRHLQTYNDGFAAATGEYLVQLSADDLLPHNSLTRAVALLEAMPGVGFVYGRTVPFRDEPPAPVTDVTGWLRWSGEDWIDARCRSGFNVIATTEVVWRASVMAEVGPYRLDLPHSGDLELWMRLATVSDVGFVVGPDQAYYRLHGANMHNEQFGSGTVDGQLIDLRERWKAFDALFEAPAGRVEHWSQLHQTVRTKLSYEALARASYAYARGFSSFPVADFEAFAEELNPDVWDSAAGRRLRRRKRLGFVSLPLHPLWGAGAVANRVWAPIATWRREKVGV
jgi:glycosyltransferase involved in cell wall biosynthesis